MEKTLKLGDKSVRITSNLSWLMVYRNQFGQDIIAVMMPAISGISDIAGGLLAELESNEITLKDIAGLAENGSLTNALIHLSSLELVDLINIVWAMAKACDDDIPEPIEWVKQFDTFPVDVIAPEVFNLALKGAMSSKNLKRLKDLRKKIQPLANQLTLKPSSSPDSNEG